MRLKEFANLVGFEISVRQKLCIGVDWSAHWSVLVRTPEHTFLEYPQCRFSIWDGVARPLLFWSYGTTLKKYLMDSFLSS